MVMISVIVSDREDRFLIDAAGKTTISDLSNRIRILSSLRAHLRHLIETMCDTVHIETGNEDMRCEQISDNMQLPPIICSQNAPPPDDRSTSACICSIPRGADACIQRARESLQNIAIPADEQELETLTQEMRVYVRGLSTQPGSATLSEPYTLEVHNIWWAGKPLVETNERGTLGDYVGRNEKTKITVSVQSTRDQPPTRTACIDSETHNNIIRYYHKRQQELKKLDEDEDDSYFSTEWSDPRGLKNGLIGNTGDIRFRI